MKAQASASPFDGARASASAMWVPALVAAVTLIGYGIGLCAEPYWLDSSELAAASFGLGVAHPPGQPLALLIGKLLTLLPLGSVALRVGWASAICGALAAGAVALLTLRMATRFRAAAVDGDTDGHAPALLAMTSGWLYAGSHGLLFSSIRPEVYALSALLVVLVALAVERFDAERDGRHLLVAALWLGLGLTNHHLLVLTLLPAILLVLVPVLTWRRLAALVGASLLGLSVYVYLPLRAAHHPLIDWGAPTTWSRFFWTVSARAFQKSVDRGAVGGSSGDATDVFLALGVELALVGALLALLGAYLLLRTRPLRTMGIFLVVALVGDALAPALVGFDPANPDAFGYLAAAVGYGAVLAVVPLALVARARWLWPLPVAVLLLGAVRLHSDSLAGPKGFEARATFDQLLREQPPRTTMVTSYFQTIFALDYLRLAEGARPDVALLHRHFLAYPGYREDVLARQPRLLPLLGARDIDVDALLQTAPRFVEYDLDLDGRLLAGSRVIEPAIPVTDDPQARRFFAWQSYLACARACALGDTTAFAVTLKEARARIGNAPELDELAARCAAKN